MHDLLESTAVDLLGDIAIVRSSRGSGIISCNPHYAIDLAAVDNCFSAVMILVADMNNIGADCSFSIRRIELTAIDREIAKAFNQNDRQIVAAKCTALHGKAAELLVSHKSANNNCTLYTHYRLSVFHIDPATGAAVLDRQIRAVNLDKIYAHIRHELQLVTVQVKNISASLEV